MSKYIIEVPVDAQYIMINGVRSGDCYTQTTYIADIEELTADYINEHFGDLQDTAYQKGFEDGKKATFALVADASNAEYQKGLNDAWECARKLFSSMADSDIEKAFPIEWNNGGFNALINLQPQEAIAKLKAYEEKQKEDDKIVVGDEVEPFYTDITGVVTLIDGDTIYILWRDGSSTSAMKLKEVTKTGRHFDIQSILEAMKA